MDNRRAFPSDLSDTIWRKLQPVVPEITKRHTTRSYTTRDIVKAIYYRISRKCAWRMLPHDLPPWWVVYYYFYRWRRDGTWQRIYEALRGRTPEVRAALMMPRPLPPRTAPAFAAPDPDAPWSTPLRKKPYVLNTLVRHVVELCRASAATRHVTVDLALSRELPVAALSPTGIATALFQLLQQVATAGSLHVVIRTEVTPHGVQLTIHDHGCLLTRQPCQHASRPCAPPHPEHYHLEPALTMAHETMAQHGGHLSLAYQCGRGTTLTLTLPLHAQ